MEIGTLVKNQSQQFGLITQKPSYAPNRRFFGEVWVEWVDGTAGFIGKDDLVIISKPQEQSWQH